MQSEPRHARTSVWALTISLAATLAIDVSFSSSGYLDVSVHRVPHHSLWIGLWLTGPTCRVSPFRDLRINVYLPLPAAFRSLSRLSSALSAKASTLRSFRFFFFGLTTSTSSMSPRPHFFEIRTYLGCLVTTFAQLSLRKRRRVTDPLRGYVT